MSATKQANTQSINGATVETWKCSDRMCNSGQTYENRDQVGRKVVSDFFGRNKNATKAIPDDIWHWQCRKGYQRAKYAADKGTAIDQKTFYMTHLRDQLIRIKLWRPQATFTIQLSKPAKARLNKYHDILRRNGNDIQDATAQVLVVPKSGKSNNKNLALALADGVKSNHADYIDTHFSGAGHTVDFILDAIFPWIEQEFSTGTMALMPPVEFLINDIQPYEVVTDPSTNYSLWTAHVDGATTVDSSSNKKRKADGDETTPAKRPRLVIKVTARRSASPVSPKSRPPIKLSLKKKIKPASEPFVDPFEAERDQAAARELLALAKKETLLPSVPSRVGELPLYVPPPPPLPRSASAERAPKRAVRAALAAKVEMEESEEESDEELAAPIMSRGMVYAGAKWRRGSDD